MLYWLFQSAPEIAADILIPPLHLKILSIGVHRMQSILNETQ